MDVVGKNEFFNLYAFCQQPALEIDRLVEVDGAVIVSVDQQHR